MDREIKGSDWKLLEGDRCTFAVLRRILKTPCRWTLTDHERFILCHSAHPFPVWIWTADGISLEEKERIWHAAMQACPLTDGYRYNLKYDLAEFFLSKAKEEGIGAAVTMNLFAYDCPRPLAPDILADGQMHLCTWDDLEEAAKIIKMFHEELAIDQGDEEGYRTKAKELICDNRLFFWKDASGQTVASCYYRPDETFAGLSGVYTIPAYRRKHYAENLVYQVTKLVERAGLCPMLNTDADYAASNACYEKIGYVLRGKLCTVGSIVHKESRP